MATLTPADRTTIHGDVMRDLSRLSESCGVLKADLKAAVDAADQWVSDNAASYNTALPQPARSALTAAQKTRLLMAVMARRFLSGV